MKNEAKGYNLSEKTILSSGIKKNGKTYIFGWDRSLANSSTKCKKIKEIRSINSEFTKVVRRRDNPWEGDQGNIEIY